MIDRVRILFLIDDFCGPEGGTEQHLLFLQRRLPRELFDLHFGVLTRLQRIKADDFPVQPVMLDGRRRGWRGGSERLGLLASYIKAAKIDVVHAFSRTSELYGCLAVKLARRGRVLGIRRNLGYWHTWRSRWTARIVGLLGGARYAANCEAARRFAAKVEWIPPRRVTVIRNPAPTDRLVQGLAAVADRESLGVVNGERVVGMVASVRPIKDYATFLRSAQMVLNRHPDTRFLAIGTQELTYMRQMQKLAEELNIDRRVRWVGPLANPLTALPLFDVAVLSSRSEALSNSVLEYAAAGVATVATDVGGTREIVDDGVTGFVVPPQSPETMAERISRLLSDNSLRRALGDNARRKAETVFCEETILDEYRRMYCELAGRDGDTPP
ncbi:MAG: glycosyltransferase family 4 protein [Planctomycetaceae bacterium]|nr:glycosyltransferase family 4 protein [Planctomycetaceae bacterium]